MSGTLSGNPQVSAALRQASLTGRAVPITINGMSLTAYPNGNVSQGTNAAGVQGLPGSPSGPAVAAPQQNSLLQRPSLITNNPVGGNTGLFTPTNQQVGATITAPQWTLPPAVATVDDYGRVISTPQPRQGVLNQANPQTTYVSPQTPQPATAAPVAGQTDTQSGPAVHATYNMPPAPDTATQARNYRAAHGLSDGSETDRLNAESLAAARAGRTSFDPTLAAQYGQPMAAGTYGPRTDVVNALTMPTTTQGQPIMLAPTVTATQQQPASPLISRTTGRPMPTYGYWQNGQYVTGPADTQQPGNNLLSQGLY